MFERLFGANFNRAVRIRSVKELSTNFKPRWLKIEIALASTAFALAAVGVLAGLAAWSLFFSIAIYGVVACVIAMALVAVAPIVLGFLGYWFPPAVVIAARLDRWLERDLDWS